MARRAVEALLDVAAEPASSSAELLERLLDAARQLVGARPAMGAIAHAVGRLVASANTASHLHPDELQRLVAEEGSALIGSRDRAASSIAVQLSPLLRDALVLTHSASATVREAVLHTPPARLFCTTSAPIEEGRSLAEDLRAEGLDVVVLEDEDVIRTLRRIVAGARRRGHRLRGRFGREQDRNAAARRGSASDRRPLGGRLRVAEACPCACRLESEPDLRDITPPELVDRIVTEEGAVPPDEVRLLMDRTPFLRDGYRLLTR